MEREAEEHERKQRNLDRTFGDGLLVEAVQQHRCLYDKTHPKYMDKQNSRNIWRTIEEITGVAVPNKRFANLRTTYKKAIQRQSSESAARPCQFPLLNEMRFLDEVPATCPTSGSFSADKLQPPEISYGGLSRQSSPEMQLHWSPSSSEQDQASTFQDHQTSQTSSTPSSVPGPGPTYRPRRRHTEPSQITYEQLLHALKQTETSPPPKTFLTGLEDTLIGMARDLPDDKRKGFLLKLINLADEIYHEFQ